MTFLTRIVSAFCVALVATCAVATAADPPGKPNRDALQKLAFLVGNWEGDATITAGPRKITLKQSEDVQLRAGGTVLVVEGIGRGTPPGSDREVVMFNALAVISWNPTKSELEMKAFTAEGKSVVPTISLREGGKGFIWEFKDPERNVDIRYTMELTSEGKWREHGEMSSDGAKTWQPFFDMLLTKKS